MTNVQQDFEVPDTHPVAATNRVLPTSPYRSLDCYIDGGGGIGLRAARAVAADTIIEELTASGLRGRGGAGFPTGVKWQTIKSFESPLLRTSIVINAAEGEPGTFKDRAIIRANPYAPIEGALIAAHALGAKSIIIATKAGFTDELTRLRSAIGEILMAGWASGVEICIVEGPYSYLFGEETALLEVIDGRPPFPRIAPPFRRGVVEIVRTAADAASGSGLSADVQMASTAADSAAPPVLVSNLETFANVPAIIAKGSEWFRSVGTTASPGTIVCTLSGAVRRPIVAEVPMGTTLREIIELAGGLQPGRTLSAVLVGVSSAPLTADLLDTALTYEAMHAVGSGLGSAGFEVVDDSTSAVAVAAGISRFLAVESCGQCSACKQDGAQISDLLGKIVRGFGTEEHLATVKLRLSTVADGARCSLATQHQVVVGGLLDAFDAEVRACLDPAAEPGTVHLIAPLIDIDEHGATLDTSFAYKQLDWTYSTTDSAKTPVDLVVDHRANGVAQADAGLESRRVPRSVIIR